MPGPGSCYRAGSLAAIVASTLVALNFATALRDFRPVSKTISKIAYLMVIALPIGACTAGDVRYAGSQDTNLEIDSQKYTSIRDRAQELTAAGRLSVAEGTRNLANARGKLRAGEEIVAQGLNISERAASAESDQDLTDAADLIKKGNELILEGRREIESAQHQVRDGRIQIEMAAELLREQ